MKFVAKMAIGHHLYIANSAFYLEFGEELLYNYTYVDMLAFLAQITLNYDPSPHTSVILIAILISYVNFLNCQIKLLFFKILNLVTWFGK